MTSTGRVMSLLILGIAVLLSTHQNPRLTAAAAAPQERQLALWGAFWTVEPDFRSTLELKNNRIDETITAHISLYFASGEKWYLSPVILEPRQTVVVDLNRAIESLPAHVAARAGKQGTLEIEFQADSPTALMGSVTTRNPEQGIAWNFLLYPGWPAEETRPLRGLFWFPDSRSDGFVAVQNISEEPLSLTPRFHVSGTSYSAPSVHLLPGQGHRVKLREELRRLGLQHVSSGGVELTYEGMPGALRAHGALFNGQGFSAEVDFLPFEQWTEERNAFFRTPRFAVGRADPLLGLPGRTKFEPFVLLHNFNGHPEQVNLLVGVDADGETREVPIPIFLSAGATLVLPLDSYLAGRIPRGGHWASLEASYSDWHNGVVLAMVSVSQDRKHSIRSVLNWVERDNRAGWYWRADSESNTLLAIQNSDVETATVRVTLDYYVDGMHYEYVLPDLSLPARGSRTVNIGEILASGQPDAAGNVIPRGVTFGGYAVRKVSAGANPNITTEPLIYNRRTKNFLSVYNTGACYEQVKVSAFQGGQPFSSILGVPLDTAQLKIEGKNSFTGSWDNITASGAFSSDNTTIATVVQSGQNKGQVTLIAPGSTFTTSVISWWRDTGFGECFYVPNWQKTTGVVVKPTVTISSGNDFAFVGTHPSIPTILRQAVGSPSGGNFAWSASNSSVSLTNANSDVVGAKGVNASSSLLDTNLIVNYSVNGVSATPATRAITVRLFRFLEQIGQIQTVQINGPPDYGYRSTVFYRLRTNPGQQVVEPGFSSITVLENVNVTSVTVNGVPAQVNFQIISGTGGTDANTQVVDDLRLISDSPLPPGLDITSEQDLFVGGFFVRTNTLHHLSSQATVTCTAPSPCTF